MANEHPFLAFGWITTPAPLELEAQVNSLDGVCTVRIGERGYFFYTMPVYADVAENDATICIKLGQVHDGSALLSTETILERGWITPTGAQYEVIEGNAALLCFSKRAPHFCAFKTLLSVPQLYYWTDGDHFLCANNLRLMADLLDGTSDGPQLNPEAVPLHFIFRSVPGHQTYLRDVYRVDHGAVFTWREGDFGSALVRDLRAYRPDVYRPVDDATVAHYFEQMVAVMGCYVNGGERRATTMLSGGVDSSTLQLAINQHPAAPKPFPTLSYAMMTPLFSREVEYAYEAAGILGADHHLVEVTPVQYADLLVQAIEILGQPPHHEPVPCAIPVARYAQANGFTFLFMGGGADVLHGASKAKEFHQAQTRYRHWPPKALRWVSAALAPVWQSKSYGAGYMADVLESLDDPASPHYPLNVSAYTDWDVMRRAFGQAKVREALVYRQALEVKYLDTQDLNEKAHVVATLSNQYDTAALWQQAMLAFGRELAFPYIDTTLLTAVMAVHPGQRYYFKHRVKPIPKTILESKSTYRLDKTKMTSGFYEDLLAWMCSGPLRDRVQAIERPAFLDQADFEQKLKQPDWFTWNLLTFDLFKKRVLAQGRRKA